MPRSFKLAAAAFVLSIGAALITRPAQAGEAEVCHAKTCTVGDEESVCCLIKSGSIVCAPCGGIDQS